jgi:dienelactone hydrolase
MSTQSRRILFFPLAMTAALMTMPVLAAETPKTATAGPASYDEQQIEVDGLPGLLDMPKGAGPFVAVVLVHGSGPQDRDEAIGPNKPFLDIAHGLAQQGIAVLRYDKRTKARPHDLADRTDYTIDDETTNDAVLAIDKLASQPHIDPGHVFVFGHSQGAMLAPRILARSGKAAGAIMLAAPGRRVLDVLSEQLHRQFSADGSVSAEEQQQLDQLAQKIAAIRGKDALTPADTLLGAYMTYWRGFDAVDPVADVEASPYPLLLLQGRHDIQVTAPDWQLWQAALQGNPRVTLKFYPQLTHIGTAGAGTPADYAAPSHVDAQLIDDAAAWIKSHS